MGFKEEQNTFQNKEKTMKRSSQIKMNVISNIEWTLNCHKVTIYFILYWLKLFNNNICTLVNV